MADPHLASCAQCRARYSAFTDWLDRIHDDAVGEADEAFPPERLAAQQAQVMRRLEALERPARVIAFPRFARPVTSTPGTRSAGWRPRRRPASSSAWRPDSSSTCAACSRRPGRSRPSRRRGSTPPPSVGAPSVVPGVALVGVRRDAVLRRRRDAHLGAAVDPSLDGRHHAAGAGPGSAAVGRWPRRPQPSPSSSARAST